MLVAAAVSRDAGSSVVHWVEWCAATVATALHVTKTTNWFFVPHTFLQPTCVSQKLKERSGEGSLRSNRQDATPAVHPSGLSIAAHGGRGAGCAGLREKSKECRGFLTLTPTCFNAEDDKAAVGTEQLLPPLAQCRGETSAASTAS
ncbi:hypothetical protein AK812_SmicGene39619 [Symbiodinium microadriaticum]|uniref:Uncharacterized protein n=1 Tax=Symbiodinium microadriaticum TaxID=2951 RepID=A0A1Q9CAR2_SYMMI|nr:hypothetical protein AK812_SmicGene39619 [Symbiodinium microadriaticum]